MAAIGSTGVHNGPAGGRGTLAGFDSRQSGVAVSELEFRMCGPIDLVARGPVELRRQRGRSAAALLLEPNRVVSIDTSSPRVLG